MSLNFSKYKTYDTAEGYGNAREWKNTFYESMGSKEASERMSKESKGPHEILGVKPGASMAEIKTAFRSMIMQWHPDRNPDNIAMAEEMSKKILAAYTVLTNKKRGYK